MVQYKNTLNNKAALEKLLLLEEWSVSKKKLQVRIV